MCHSPRVRRHTSGHACRAAAPLQPPDSAGGGARGRRRRRVRAARRARRAARLAGRERHPALHRRGRAHRDAHRHRRRRPGAARLAGQGGDRRRPLQHGRAGRHRRRAAPRHAAHEARPLAARRRAPGEGAGRHHLARPAGRARPARPVGADDAELFQLHGRRRRVGQRPRPLCRPRAGLLLGAGAAGRARRRPRGRGQPPGEHRADRGIAHARRLVTEASSTSRQQPDGSALEACPGRHPSFFTGNCWRSRHRSTSRLLPADVVRR